MTTSHAKRNARRRWAVRLRVAAVTVITAVFVFPVYWLFMTAFKSPEETFANPPVWFPSTFNLNNFAAMMEGDDLRSIFNSLVVATVSTVVAMFLGSIAAYSLARYRTGGAQMSIWIMSLRMVPPMALAFPLFLMFAMFGLIDSYPGLIALYVAINLPYVIWVMRGFIEDIAPSLKKVR